MKKIAGILKEHWRVLVLSTLVLIIVGVGAAVGIRHILSTSKDTVELTQEELELELIDVDLQKHYKPEYFQRLSYEIIEVTKENETYKVYLLTYLVSNDRNEIWTYAARVKKTSDGWDVDTERVYYK